MELWIIIFGMAVVTYLPRLLPLTTLKEETLPVWLKRMLHYVPIAVLSALIGTEFLPSKAWLHYTIDAHLVAGLSAIGVAWFTRSTFLTIITGLGCLVLFG